jgi:HEAT repeat protein
LADGVLGHEILFRYGAAAVLTEIGPPALPTLVHLISAGEPEVRCVAICALGQIRDVRCVPQLVLTLLDESTHVRADAAIALGEIGSLRALDPLMDQLTDSEPGVRAAAIVALGKLGDRRATLPILAVVRKGYDYLTDPAAVEAFGLLRDSRAVGFLLSKNLQDRSVAQALGMIGDVRSVQPLIRELEKREFIFHVASALGEIGDKRAVMPLAAVLEEFLGRDPRPEDEEAGLPEVIVALGRLRDERAVGVLQRASRVSALEWYSAQELATRALSEIGTECAAAVLRENLGCDSPRVRETAAAALDVARKLPSLS